MIVFVLTLIAWGVNFNNLCRNTSDNSIFRHVVYHQCMCTDNSIITHMHTTKD